MVRTKADTTGVKVSGAKAPRKALSTPTRSASDSNDNKNKGYQGGNSYHPRETPGWQKPITTFFGAPSTIPKSSDGSGSSKAENSPDSSSPDADSSSTT